MAGNWTTTRVPEPIHVRVAAYSILTRMYVYVPGQSRRHDAMARCGWRVMRRKCCRELHRGVRHHLALHSPRRGNKSRWSRSTGVLAVDPDCMLMPRIESRPTQRLLTLKSLFINVQVILLTPTLPVCRTQINWITGKGIFVPITVTACGNYAEEEYEDEEKTYIERMKLVRGRNFSTSSTRSPVSAIIARWLRITRRLVLFSNEQFSLCGLYASFVSQRFLVNFVRKRYFAIQNFR